MIRTSLVTLIGTILLCGCQQDFPSRDEVVNGSKAIQQGPAFSSSRGSQSSSEGKHNFFKGSFLVTLEDFETSSEGDFDVEYFLWEVFQSYGKFIQAHIDIDSIPLMIYKGGSSKPDLNSHRHDYDFISRDVSVQYDVEWFRGGPKEPQHGNPTVQVRYQIRINQTYEFPIPISDTWAKAVGTLSELEKNEGWLVCQACS